MKRRYLLITLPISALWTSPAATSPSHLLQARQETETVPATAQLSFRNRRALVSWVARGEQSEDGTLAHADGNIYVAERASRSIPDLPGWEPAGQANVLHWGAVGDCSDTGVGTDDTPAIQHALVWWASAERRTLVFPGDGRVYRMTAGVSIDCRKNFLGLLRMEGPIRPDAAAFDALTFLDGRQATFKLKVDGGGVTADYTQADPNRMSQAFVFQGIQESIFYVQAEAYKGRVLRLKEKSDSQLSTSKNTFMQVTTGDIIEDRDRACGQAWFFDTHTSAFGHVVSAITFWDDYGWIFEDCGDILIGQIDGGTNNRSGYEFRGVYSLWANAITNGDGSQKLDLFTFRNSLVTGKACYNISINTIFVTEGAHGVVLKNIGDADENGITIGAIKGRRQKNWTVKLVDCRGANISIDSRLSGGALSMSGSLTKGCHVRINDSGSARSALHVAASTGEDNALTGRILNGNRHETRNTPLITIATPETTDLSGLRLQSDKVSFLADFPERNRIRWFGGRVAAKAEAGLFSNPPDLAHGVDGYRTEQVGTFIVKTGRTEATIPHGLHARPVFVTVNTPGAPDVPAPRVIALDQTHFQIALNQAADSDLSVSWHALTEAAIQN